VGVSRTRHIQLAVTDHTDDRQCRAVVVSLHGEPVRSRQRCDTGPAGLPAFGLHGIDDGVPAAEVAQFCHVDINAMCPTLSVDAGGPPAMRGAAASQLPAKGPGVVSPWHFDLILLTVAID
jgi:hypothetical protein